MNIKNTINKIFNSSFLTQQMKSMTMYTTDSCKYNTADQQKDKPSLVHNTLLKIQINTEILQMINTIMNKPRTNGKTFGWNLLLPMSKQ